MSYPSTCALSQRPQLTHNPLSSPHGERERSAPVMIVVAGPSGSGKSSNFPIQSMGVPYFSVDDCGAAAARATARGSKIYVEKQSIGEMGFIAIVGDSEGNSIGLHSWV